MADDDESRTHFGFESVAESEKAERVQQVFDRVADRYDLMNDLMSFGLHRLWKRFALQLSGLRAGQRALDMATGSGDLALLLGRRLTPKGQLVVTDINPQMLRRARQKLDDAGLVTAETVVADSEHLPFARSCFDAVTVAFGLRNMTHPEQALAEARRVLRPGAPLLVLEFSQLQIASLQPLYDRYSFSWLPALGKMVAKDAESYRYLAESIRRHPPQQRLSEMMEEAGFIAVRCFNICGGIVALHRGYST